MLKEPTVLVLGAGASFDLDFPLGPDLSSQIQNECKGLAADGGDSSLSRLVYEGFLGREIVDLRKRAEILWQGLGTAKSIDDFLDRRSDDALLIQLAKVCVALLIVRAEQGVAGKIKTCWQSTPFRLHYHNRLGNTVSVRYWLATFLSHLFSGVRHKTLESDLEKALENLSVITFNYDRTFEYFFMQYLRHAYTIDERQAARLTTQYLSAFHIYGQVASQAPLDQQFANRDRFDSNANITHIVEGATGIRTIHESVHDHPELHMAKTALSKVERILFIGNSYIEQNMALLQGATKRCRVWASAYGLSDEHKQQADTLITKFFKADFRCIKGDWTAEKMLCDIVETL